MKQKIINQYYLLSCLFSAGGTSLISAIYTMFLMKHGLNLFEVNLVNALFYITIFVCEIPTGAFADIFGRKKSFVIACGLMSISMFIYGHSTSFIGFVVAEIIGAIGMTFRSGAFQAWFVDSLKHHGYEGDLTGIFARRTLITQIGNGIGAIIGSYLSIIDPSLPWYFGGVALIVTTIIAQTIMKEDYFIKTKISWKNGLQSLKNVTVISLRYGIHNKAVRFVLVITGIQIFAVQALNMYWQPFFKDHGVKEVHTGYLFNMILISIVIGASIVSKLKKFGSDKSLILKTQIAVGVTVILTVLFPNMPFVAIFFLLHEMGRGCWTPLLENYLQSSIPSKERATIASFCSVAPHIGGAIGLLVSGWIAKNYGISVSWFVMGLVFIIGALLVSKNGIKTNT